MRRVEPVSLTVTGLPAATAGVATTTEAEASGLAAPTGAATGGGAPGECGDVRAAEGSASSA